MRAMRAASPSFRRKPIAAVLVVLCLVLSGCTARFIYNRLDTVATWYFQSLVSLNDAQRSELRAWLERTLAWHRESELERYAAFVQDVSLAVRQPASRATFESIRQRFSGLIDTLVQKTAPEASELLLRLSPEQVDELLANLEKRTEKSTKESAETLANGKWQTKQVRDIVRQVKRWTGSITPEQMKIIEGTVAELEPTYEDWAESQTAWRNALRDPIASARTESDEQPVQRVLAVLKDPDQYWTSDYAAKVARNGERYERMLLALDATLTTKQREHLRRELDELAGTLIKLARN
ncbi:MAG TPA: DUF6279 family lipoprotein [Steroidobacteraceae bacterium]